MTDRELNEIEWTERVKDFLKSGMSRAEYCQKNDINSQTLLGWIGRHYEVSSNLIPVKISDKERYVLPKQALLELEISGGHKLSIHDKSVLCEELGSMMAKIAKTSNSHHTQD